MSRFFPSFLLNFSMTWVRFWWGIFCTNCYGFLCDELLVLSTFLILTPKFSIGYRQWKWHTVPDDHNLRTFWCSACKSPTTFWPSHPDKFILIVVRTLHECFTYQFVSLLQRRFKHFCVMSGALCLFWPHSTFLYVCVLACAISNMFVEAVHFTICRVDRPIFVLAFTLVICKGKPIDTYIRTSSKQSPFSVAFSSIWLCQFPGLPQRASPSNIAAKRFHLSGFHHECRLWLS